MQLNLGNMIIVKTREEIELIRQSALIVSKTLGMLAKEIKEGVTTNHLDTIAEEFIRDHGALPGFKGLYDCPSTLLCSVNEAVVHGLPTDVPLKDGDIVSALIKAQNRINYIEEKIFYGDSLYFEIINDLVILENKINRLSMELHNKKPMETKVSVKPISSMQEFENEYKSAYYAYTKGDYSLSMKLFKDLILLDNKNELSDNCQYWISEIHYAKGEFDIAINEFGKVLGYANTNKGAESLYKSGLCHLKLNNINEATRNFEKLETLYPEKNVLIDKSKKHLEHGK